MSREKAMNAQMVQDERGLGEVQIADDVVSIIAGLAAAEVKGVASLAGNPSKERTGRYGVKGAAKNVKVDVLEGVVNVDMTLYLEYGYSIPDTCKKVQEKVKSAIENMTGLQVCEVNVRIAGVAMDNMK